MTTHEMPETIWARPEHTDAPAYGPWWQTYQDEDMVAQYTRTDLAQAAIAAAMMGAVKPLEWDGEDGHGFGPALPDGVSYIVIDESGDGDYSWELLARGRMLEDSSGVMWRSIVEAREGANRHYIRAVAESLTIPTDATAALEAMLAEAEKRGRDRGLEQAAAKIIELYDCGKGEKWAAKIRAMKGGE